MDKYVKPAYDLKVILPVFVWEIFNILQLCQGHLKIIVVLTSNHRTYEYNPILIIEY